MNVLTLTTNDQLDEYSKSSYKLIKEGKYDKVIFKGITGLPGGYVRNVVNPFYFDQIPEVEVQNCTIEDDISIYSVKKPLKIIIKDSTIQGFYAIDISSIELVMDNVTSGAVNISIPSNNKYSSVTFKNSKLHITGLDGLNASNIELSNNHDTIMNGLPVKCIPDDVAKQSAFLSQFIELITIVTPSKIDEFNYQFDQTDWDKLILLLDSHPDQFKNIKFDISFIDILQRSTDDIYIHIPSTTFPLDWISALDSSADPDLNSPSKSLFAKDCAWFYVNKNNGHNFTITHINKITQWIQYRIQGFLIADNYKDIIAKQPVNNVSGTRNSLSLYHPVLSYSNILSGKMVTTEITLLPNTYSLIRTIGSDMKIKRIKEVTRFYGKTIKVTGMEPFMLFSVAGTKCLDIGGEIEVDRAGSEVFIDGNITIKMLYTADIDGNTTIQQKTYTDIIGSMAVNQIESSIDGDVSIKAVLETMMGGTISVAILNQEMDIDGDIVIPGIEKIITGKVNIQPIVSATITGEIAINLIDYELDGSFRLAQAVSTDIIGDIEVRVCRIEILGYFEIPMEEVWG